MSFLMETIKEFTANNPPPWSICIYTVPADGRPAHEYTAGFCTFIADDVDYPNEGIVSFLRGGGNEGMFVFITDFIDVVERTDRGFWFPYPNLEVRADGFEPYPAVVISKTI